MSTQTRLSMEPHAYRKLVWIAVLVFSCGMVVLLVMTGRRLFHIFMVLGKKDVLNTCVRA